MSTGGLAISWIRNTKYSSPFLPSSLWSVATLGFLLLWVGVVGGKGISEYISQRPHPNLPASKSWVVPLHAWPVQEGGTSSLNSIPAPSMPWTLDNTALGITQRESSLLGDPKPCPLRLWSDIFEATTRKE